MESSSSGPSSTTVNASKLAHGENYAQIDGQINNRTKPQV
jgi:hypothetical protein